MYIHKKKIRRKIARQLTMMILQRNQVRFLWIKGLESEDYINHKQEILTIFYKELRYRFVWIQKNKMNHNMTCLYYEES